MLAIPLVLALVSGFAVVELVHPRRISRTFESTRHTRSAVGFELALRLALGLGLGLSLHSTFAYASLLFVRSLVPALVIETILALAAIALLVVRGKRTAREQEEFAHEIAQAGELAGAASSSSSIIDRQEPAWVDWLFTLSLVVSTGVLIALPILRWTQAPHGYWDAWQMWTPKAVILFRGGESWTDRLSTTYSHPGYPLLVPLTTARFWTWGGAPFDLGAAFANSYSYALATIGVVIGVTGMLGGKRAATIAAAALCAAPAFPAWTAALYADLQVSFHVVAVTALLAWALTTVRDPTGLVTLAGIAVGGVLWSKNEGMMLSLAAVPAIAITLFARSGSRNGTVAIAGFALGVCPFLLCLAHFKLMIAPQGDLFAALVSMDIGSTLFAMNRWEHVLRHSLRVALQERLPLVAAIFGVVALWRRPSAPQRLRWALASFPMLAMLGYLYVYLRTPHDLNWHLATSLSRIFLHVFPAAIVAIFVTCFDFKSIQVWPRTVSVDPGDFHGARTLSRSHLLGGLISACVSRIPSRMLPKPAATVWLAALAVLTFIPSSYQAYTRNQSVEPPRWKSLYSGFSTTRMETLGRLIDESESVSVDGASGQNLRARSSVLAAAQYYLAPRKVAVDIKSPWIIAFHKTEDESLAYAASQSLTVVSDLRNGLRLYHRGSLESNTAGGSNRTLR